MKKLVVLVAVLGMLGLGAEFAAASYAENQIETQASASARDTAAVSADLRSFPLVTRLLVTGSVRQLVVDLDEVAHQRLTFANVRFDLRGIELDRNALLQQDIYVRDIDTATITAELRGDGLSLILGPLVDLTPDGSITVSATRGSLQIGGTRIPTANVPLPSDLLPCDPAAELFRDRIVLTCTVNEIPPVLVRALQGRAP